eukprot:4286513-Prymnesium_polylepis.1
MAITSPWAAHTRGRAPAAARVPEPRAAAASAAAVGGRGLRPVGGGRERERRAEGRRVARARVDPAAGLGARGVLDRVGPRLALLVVEVAAVLDRVEARREL